MCITKHRIFNFVVFSSVLARTSKNRCRLFTFRISWALKCNNLIMEEAQDTKSEIFNKSSMSVVELNNYVRIFLVY